MCIDEYHKKYLQLHGIMSIDENQKNIYNYRF